MWCLSTVLCLLIAFVFPNTVFALSKAQRSLYTKNILYYDLEACPAGAASPSGGNAQVEAVLKSIAERNTTGTTAISVSHISGNTVSAVNGDKQMATRSTYKIYVAYAILKAIKDGKFSWASVSNDFNNMIISSDNVAAEKLLNMNAVGGPSGITRLLQDEVGLSDKTVMGTGSHTDSSGTTGSLSTANDFIKFLKKLENRNLPGLDKGSDGELYNHLLSAMKQQSARTTGIKAGVDPGTEVADKPGWGPVPPTGGIGAATNDVGIVYIPNKYAVAILTDFPNENWEYIANAAKEINEVMKSTPDSTSSVPTGSEGRGSETSQPQSDIQYKTAGNIPLGGITTLATTYGGKYSNGQWVPSNEIQGGGDDDTGYASFGDIPLPGKTAIAELGNGEAMGHLPYGKDGPNVKNTKLELTYRGKSIIAEKWDWGTGGSHGAKIDLWWETARLLGVRGENPTIKVRVVDESTPVTPVDGTAQPAVDGETVAVCCPENGSGSAAALTGGTNEEKVWNFFIGKGLEPFQAAGIIGNMYAESAVEPQRLQGTSPGTRTPADQVSGDIGWGLVQWTPASKFIDPTKAAGKDPNDIAVQLEFLWDQLEGRGPIPEKQAGDDLKATTNIEDAVRAFQGDSRIGGRYTGYERPADQQGSLQTRIDKARDVLARYGSGSAGSGTVGGSGGGACPSPAAGDNGEIVGNFSLPVDKKYKDSFNDPHHDYPAIDIPVPNGEKIYSMTGGKVVSAGDGYNGGMGTHVYVDAGDGVFFKYFHGVSGSLRVAIGDTIAPGKLLMLADNSGRSYGNHLHLEITMGSAYGTKKCPQKLLMGIVEGDPPDIESLPESGCIE